MDLPIQFLENEACCKNCKFWDDPYQEGYGRCKRYPPQFWSEGGSHGSDFICVSEKEWCGEFKYREQGWVLPKGFKIFDDEGKEIGQT